MWKHVHFFPFDTSSKLNAAISTVEPMTRGNMQPLLPRSLGITICEQGRQQGGGQHHKMALSDSASGKVVPDTQPSEVLTDALVETRDAAGPGPVATDLVSGKVSPNPQPREVPTDALAMADSPNTTIVGSLNLRRVQIEERSRGPGEAFKPTWIKENYIQESI
ncbi:hypothetical protein B0H14DRAFT_3137493 [Mycena olivaceomarginata]|nr:hypothetical protein B0H14DRAFT_3137493 [Mycena olivaceomarginata]